MAHTFFASESLTPYNTPTAVTPYLEGQGDFVSMLIMRIIRVSYRGS